MKRLAILIMAASLLVPVIGHAQDTFGFRSGADQMRIKLMEAWLLLNTNTYYLLTEAGAIFNTEAGDRITYE